jgi:uncharacterized membrane protein YozB (DUF420 family)
MAGHCRHGGAMTAHALSRSRFFLLSGWAMVALALISFPFTYFGPMADGSRRFYGLLHIHGALCFVWLLLYAWQVQLTAQRKIARHREWGLAGAWLSGAVVFTGVPMIAAAAMRRIAAGDPAPFFYSAYNLVDIGLFTLMSSLAILTASRQPDWHRRFMLGAAVALFVAAASRLMLVLPPAPPWTDLGSAVIGDLLLLALAVHDRRAGCIHPATWLLLAVMIPAHLSAPLLGQSALVRDQIAPALVDMMAIAPPDQR